MPSVPRSPQGAVERAATGAGHPRTGQENNGTKDTENRLYKRYFRQGRTYPESVDLNYKEEVAGSNPARPLQIGAFRRENTKYQKGSQGPGAFLYSPG